MKPLASFIIPVHNGGAYLAQCLDSCISQTQGRIEIIVVNDGSTDRTDKIISHYQSKDSRIMNCKFETNKGRSEARNYGIQESTSDILMMLDADDMAGPKRAEDTISYFKKNPGVSIVYGEFMIIDAYGNILASQPAIPFDKKKIEQFKMFGIGHSTMSFRRKVTEKVIYTSGEYSKHGIDDWKFQLDAMKAGYRFAAVSRLWAMRRLTNKVGNLWAETPRDEAKIKELKEAALAWNDEKVITPLCFDSEEDFREWQSMARKTNISPRNYCLDCLPEFQKEMKEKHRCLHHKVYFVKDSDGATVGTSVLNSKRVITT